MSLELKTTKYQLSKIVKNNQLNKRNQEEITGLKGNLPLDVK